MKSIKRLLIALPLLGTIVSPSAVLTLGGLTVAASISGCSSPAQRARGRQDARIDNRTDDRYKRRHGN